MCGTCRYLHVADKINSNEVICIVILYAVTIIKVRYVRWLSAPLVSTTFSAPPLKRIAVWRVLEGAFKYKNKYVKKRNTLRIR